MDRVIRGGGVRTVNYVKTALPVTGGAAAIGGGVSALGALLTGLTLLVIGFAILASARRRRLDRIHIGK
jgi:hypothetical protein